MASVFLSYARDNSATARHFAQALEKAGHHVWWDLHVRGGSQFSKVIEEALKAADVVVVLWSKDSVESPWVRDEAASGRDSGRLVPVTIDGTQPPLGFRQFQTIDLSRWKSRGNPPGLRTLLADIAAIAGTEGSTKQAVDAAPAVSANQPRFVPTRALVVAVTGVIALLFAGTGVYWLLTPRVTIPTVAVAAADRSALSQSMARNVSINLGSVAPNSGTHFRLIESGSDGQPDLRVSVGALTDSAGVRSTVALVSADKAVLWSKQIEQPISHRSDLEESVAHSAMAAVACAADAFNGRAAHLSADQLRGFINACVSLDEGADPQPLIAVFRRTTEAAPKFAVGWAQLLRAETQTLTGLVNLRNPVGALPSAIKRDAASARRLDPALPEVTVAEIEVQPDIPFLRAIASIDQAKSAAPDSPALLEERSGLLAKVGRMDEAAQDLERAVELKPYSPHLRGNLIFILASAGRVQAAWSEAVRAKQLWPDAPDVEHADNFLNLRFGDFEKTWRESGGATDGGILGYFKILHDPSDANIKAWTKLIETHQMLRPHRLFILQALGPLNRVELLYDYLDKWPIEKDLQGMTYILFRPYMSAVRRNPRFMRLAQRLGLLDYWEKSGKWPDFCAEPDIPYKCEEEAAKLHA